MKNKELLRPVPIDQLPLPGTGILSRRALLGGFVGVTVTGGLWKYGFGRSTSNPSSALASVDRMSSGIDRQDNARVASSSLPDGTPAPELSGAEKLGVPWMPRVVGQYADLFIEMGGKYGVDPAALAILTIIESGGLPDAHSPAGAVGLMQLMPPTAREMARDLGWTDFDVSQLVDPRVSIELGAKYYAQQMAAFGKPDDPDWLYSVLMGATAYNGGPGTAARFIKTGDLNPETTSYRQLVGGMWTERALPASPTYQNWYDTMGHVWIDEGERRFFPTPTPEATSTQ